MAKNQWNLAHFRTRIKVSFQFKLSLSLVWYDLGTTWIGVIDLTHQSVTVGSQTMKVQTENLLYFHNADEETVRDHERLERDERVIFVTFFFIECINILNVCVLCFGNKSLFEGSSNIWRFFAPISLSRALQWKVHLRKSHAHHPHFFSFSGLDDFRWASLISKK